jgi:hypothetical protein
MVAPGCPLGRPGLRPVFFRNDFGAGLPSPSDDGGLLEFFEFCPRPRRQLGNLRLKIGYQHPQLRNLRIPFGQQLPQPGVRRTQPSRIAGHIGYIGHRPHFTTAGVP